MRALPKPVHDTPEASTRPSTWPGAKPHIFVLPDYVRLSRKATRTGKPQPPIIGGEGKDDGQVFLQECDDAAAWRGLFSPLWQYRPALACATIRWETSEGDATGGAAAFVL
jgi:hypothetical protein